MKPKKQKQLDTRARILIARHTWGLWDITNQLKIKPIAASILVCCGLNQRETRNHFTLRNFINQSTRDIEASHLKQNMLSATLLLWSTDTNIQL